MNGRAGDRCPVATTPRGLTQTDAQVQAGLVLGGILGHEPTDGRDVAHRRWCSSRHFGQIHTEERGLVPK